MERHTIRRRSAESIRHRCENGRDRCGQKESQRIGLRGYGQKDPLVEFKKEAFLLFEDMMGRIDTETVRYLFLVQPAKPEDEAREIERRQRRQQQELQYQAGAAQTEEPKPIRTGAKVGRNDPCPCGSGKKYKKCHGASV